ncbi:MAG: aminotransferase class I/II-fold pyridoxal phosphate-dependent enzyme [SAR324 cluster bacterium]|nr:aminotransferase class I/II-fold pyridoxal phosphate-dependent enzyme [SAR324 cluster bacterium]
MKSLAPRSWIPSSSEEFIQNYAQNHANSTEDELEKEINQLIRENRKIHDLECINLNPASNVMNPKAEKALSLGLGTRASLGYPGDKYEMGLEAIEKIEILAAKLTCEVFNAKFAEIRVASGAMANLYAFMTACKARDTIIVPSATIGGHVTHHAQGTAGLYGLKMHSAPVDPENYTYDIDALRIQAKTLSPKLITIGGSLNLFPHPIRDIRAIADEVGALVLFDAAHLSGMIAGKAWQQPLEEGAHMMTMSTYKSLGGPPSGLIVTNDADLAERIEKIAFPGLTANFDVAKSASLAISLLDWKSHGQKYAAQMAKTAKALAEALASRGLPVFAANKEFTNSHQFAVEAKQFGGGQEAAKLLRRGNILACGIGLPIESLKNDLNGLRLGTPEIVRWGMKPEHMMDLASLIDRILNGDEKPEQVAPDTRSFRMQFQSLHYIR